MQVGGARTEDCAREFESPAHTTASDAARIEELAVHQIDSLLDPNLSAEERERRIRRLTEGPPEFSHQRIDLPKHQT